MAYLLERDALNGKEGRAVCTINGRQVELFGVKNLKIDYSLDSSDFKVVGTRLVQKKTTGVQLSGTMTIVYGTPQFKQMVKDYMVTGAVPYFTLQITNNDPATSVGEQTIALYNCRLNSGNIAQLDADADFLTEDVSFDFTQFEILKAFHEPAQLGGGIL
jgi:hypothetical protein